MNFSEQFHIEGENMSDGMISLFRAKHINDGMLYQYAEDLWSNQLQFLQSIISSMMRRIPRMMWKWVKIP
jgi:hypothetical protein